MRVFSETDPLPVLKGTPEWTKVSGQLGRCGAAGEAANKGQEVELDQEFVEEGRVLADLRDTVTSLVSALATVERTLSLLAEKRSLSFEQPALALVPTSPSRRPSKVSPR